MSAPITAVLPWSFSRAESWPKHSPTNPAAFALPGPISGGHISSQRERMLCPNPAMLRRRAVPSVLAHSALQFLLSMAEPIQRLPRAADGEPGQGSCFRNLLFLPISLFTSLHSPRDGAWGQGSCCGSAWSFIVKIKLKRALGKAEILSCPYHQGRSWKASWDTTESSTELYE